MQVPVDCLGVCMCLILLRVLAHVLNLKCVLRDDWAMLCVCGGVCCFEVCLCYKDAETQLF